LGPHAEGDPAYETLCVAADRMVSELEGSVDRRAVTVMMDDALAASLLRTERVDTLMVGYHSFMIGRNDLESMSARLGYFGLIAFTDDRMLAAYATGIVRVKRRAEAFDTGPTVRLNARAADVGGSLVPMIDVHNSGGWHRLLLPGTSMVSEEQAAAWGRHLVERLTGRVKPIWDAHGLAGWSTDGDRPTNDDATPIRGTPVIDAPGPRERPRILPG
jgi:hypothetical protein